MISRARTLDGEIVEGYYNPPIYRSTGEIIINPYINVSKGNSEEIDPSTLEYKIGDEWYSMEDLEKLVNEPKVTNISTVGTLSIKF